MKYILSAFFLTVLSACSSTVPTVDDTASIIKTNDAKTAMVVTANPLASKAGADVLRAGGSAVDAAIAIEAVLSLVEPQSSGLAGGGFMTYFDNATKQVSIYDGRETAPKSVSSDMFLDDEGESIGFINAKTSGLSTGVPGMVSMLEIAHEDHGKLAWGPQFDAAKQLAVQGFPVSERLHGMITRFGKYIPSSLEQGPIDAYNYFIDAKGEPIAVGSLLKNPDYAHALELIASDPSNFYKGDIANKIVEQTSHAPRAGGLSLDDLANYQAQKRVALCSTYKESTLCGPPPASSWVAVAEIMGLLEYAPAFSSSGSMDAENWGIFADAQRLAYADRDQYVGDNVFVDVPLDGLLNPEYLKLRAQQIKRGSAIESIKAGDAWSYSQADAVAYGVDATNDVAGTTHFVVVDGDGNVVSLTASVESIFGSTRMAAGMFLNNQLTDFSFKSVDEAGMPIANRIEPNKRPRSSMSPTIALDKNGEFLMATGSPGGNSIIAYTAKTLVGVLDWGLSPQQAVDLPNMVARKGRLRIESDRASTELVESLRDYGFEVKESAGENSGLSVVYRHADGRLEGGVDSRREGVIEIVNLSQ